MYSPQIADSHIRCLYKLAKRLNISMVKLVDIIISHALHELKHGASPLTIACQQAEKTGKYRPRVRHVG